MEKVATVEIDLAMRVFALHGLDAEGRVVLRKTVARGELPATVAALQPCLIGMEAGAAELRHSSSPSPVRRKVAAQSVRWIHNHNREHHAPSSAGPIIGTLECLITRSGIR